MTARRAFTRPDIARQSWRQALLAAAGIPGAYAETGTVVRDRPHWQHCSESSQAIRAWAARIPGARQP
jgi:hypothetical protein